MSNALLYVTAVVVWGSTWLAITFQLGEVSPPVSLVYRYGLAAALLFGWCVWRGLNLRFSWRSHGLFAVLGLFLFCLNYIGTYNAQHYISSALNAVTFSTMMWMNVINSRVFFKTRIEPRVYAGAVFGMVGIGTLFWPEISVISWTDTTILGVSLCLGGALLASFGNMVSQKAQQQALPIIQSNAWGMLYGTGFLLLIAVARGQPFIFDPQPAYVISLLYLSIFGSIVGFGTYLKLLGRIGAHKAGYAVVTFPLVALILSVLFEGLRIEAHLLVGMGLVLLGNVIVLGGVGGLVRVIRSLFHRSRRMITHTPPAH